ncbi:MAG: hypothetical protein F4038_10205 [Chloroflexi bacterium]|nr:hypothetical protein [Chloroflexota bacterium]MCY3588681.1 hypothetical protein [Chloroflexota bacterium]MCY3687270.1 hypothetical protein [Chloroflexota bacterium]MDE2709841.1 hypothetical protein [Chloroflexota bacterium]MYA02342.1 hypothetical protein [Chloroflexota bacterium]
MSNARPGQQDIQDRYWAIANDPNERGYARVRALDSLARLLDLFPRSQHPDLSTDEPEAEPTDPHLAVAAMSDEQLDALIASEKAAAKSNAGSEPDDADDEESNEDEDEPP